HYSGVGAGDRELRGSGAIRRRTAGLDLYTGPPGKRAAGARRPKMTATFRLPDASWLGAPALARALSILNGGGEEARVVGGAQRPDGAAPKRHRDCHYGTAGRGGAPRDGGRIEDRADRYRTRHRHAGD